MIRRTYTGPTRRKILKTTLVGGLLAGALPLSACQEPKVGKSAVHYRDKPHKTQHCSVCQFFIEPNSCQRVDGEINPDGWCTFFKRVV